MHQEQFVFLASTEYKKSIMITRVHFDTTISYLMQHSYLNYYKI